MNIFRRPDYQSDITQFFNQLRAEKPHLAQAQRDGRALLWDREVHAEQAAQFQAARVAQKAYPYQV